MTKNLLIKRANRFAITALFICFIAPAFAQTSGQQPTHATGLKFDKEADTYIRTHFKRISGVRPNRLAIDRINAHRAKQHRSNLIIPASASENEEIISAIASTNGKMMPLSAAPSAAVGVAPSDLPPSVDNSQTPWFPPVGNQGGLGSCAPYSVLYYQLSYTMAKDRNIDIRSGDPSKLYSPKWGYNFTNGGVNGGSYWSPIYSILQQMGAPTLSDWNYDGNYWEWPLDKKV